MAVFINKVVTRHGDKGETTLGDGSRISKASKRIELLGILDEANAHIGVFLLSITPEDTIRPWILRLQSLLFDIGSFLSVPGMECSSKEDISASAISIVAEIEKNLEKLRALQAPLHSFILPGGSPASSYAHVVRTIIRRAERQLVDLAQQDPTIDASFIAILNRLSDYFFVLARHYNKDGRADILWEKGFESRPSS